VFVHDILLDVCSKLIVVERLCGLKTSIRQGRHEGVAELGIVVSHRGGDVEESNLRNIKKSTSQLHCSFCPIISFRVCEILDGLYEEEVSKTPLGSWRGGSSLCSNDSQQDERSRGFDCNVEDAEEVLPKRGYGRDREKMGRRRATTRQSPMETAGLTSFDQ